MQFPHKKQSEVIHIDETFVQINNITYRKHDSHHEEKELKIIGELVHIVGKLIGENKHQKVRLALIQNINSSKFIIMALTINSNQFSLGNLALVDSDNGNLVSATFSNVSFSGTNDAAFTVSPDSSDTTGNTARVTGVAAGAGSVNATAAASYTDANTQQPVQKTLTVSVDVTVAAVVAGENVTLQLNFGAAQNQ